jgi:hypothetical protein
MTTACLEKTLGVECEPVCDSVVKKVVDSNTVVLANGQNFDLARFSEYPMDNYRGRSQKLCLEIALEGKRITYYLQSDNKISIRNIPMRCN